MALCTSKDGLRFGTKVEVLAASSSVNHHARMAGLALLDAEERTQLFFEGRNASSRCCNMRFVGEGDANYSVHFGGDADEVRLDVGGGWDSAWSQDPGTRIVVAALPHDKVPSCARELTRLGRAVTFREPCATYELPSAEWDTLCCGGGSAESPAPWVSSQTLDCAEVSAAYGLPPGLLLGTLLPGDAEVVNEMWKYKTGRSVEMVRSGIASRPSAGLRNADGRLISWIVLRSDGSMGLLHTLPEYRGKGLARQVVKFVSLQIRRWQYALQGEAAAARADGSGGRKAPEEADNLALAASLAQRVVPFCHIKLGNVQSEAVFRGLGFVEVNRATWVLSAALAPRFKLRPLRLDADSTGHSELHDLLQLINTSYKQDDAFFVDQTRTSEPVLRDMARKGVFFVGYRMDVRAGDAAGAGLDSAPFPSCGGWACQADVPATACAAHPAELREEGSRELLTAVYVSVGADGDGEGRAAEGATRVASLSMLTIAPSLKRLGCGQRVLDWALSTAADPRGGGGWGCGAVEVYVVSVKPWLLSFYTDKNRFREVGREDWPTPHELVIPCFFHRVRREL